MRSHRLLAIDVRALPTWERHPKIFTAFDGLETGEELRIVSDHEPRPLREEFERAYPRRYVWLQRMLGTDHWEVVLRRVAMAAGEQPPDVLRRCSVFADVAAETLDALATAALEKALRHNEPIAEQGVAWDGFGVVAAGTLAAIIGSALGREHLLFEILPGEGFGEVSTIDGGTTPARFVAVSRSARVVCLPKATMRAALQTDPALARAMNDLCAQRLRVIIERFAAQTALPTVARVAGALLPYAAPEPGLNPVLASFQMTQGDLAIVAGTVKEVVSRALAELEQACAIERAGGHVVKLDREKLHTFASSL